MNNLPQNSDLRFVEDLHENFLQEERGRLISILVNGLLTCLAIYGGLTIGSQCYQIYKDGQQSIIDAKK